MKKLSVAVIVPIFPNIVQTYVLSQIVALKNSDINTVIVAGKRGKYKKLPPAISEYNILDDTIYISTEYNNVLKEILSLPLQNKLYIKALKTIIKSRSWQKYGIKYFIKVLIRSKIFTNTFNIIHSHSLFTSYDYLFLKEHFSIPIVTTYHGMVPEGVKQLDKDKQKMLFEKGDLFIVNTEFSKQQLIELGCLQEKIKIIPQGINLKEFPFFKRSIDRGGKINLLTVGRLSIEKGHDTAIKAIAKVAKIYPMLEYNIVGDGPEKNNLAKLISDYRLEGIVKLRGVKVGKELLQYYSNAHIFVLPSNTETQGVVLQEAQASGIPIIASRVGGIPEVIIENNTGLLYEAQNHNNLADMIQLLVHNPILYQEICIASRKDIEKKFDISVVCNKLVDTYKEFIPSN